MTAPVTETEYLDNEGLAEFPGLPDGPELIDLRDHGEVLDAHPRPEPPEAPESPAKPKRRAPSEVPLHRLLDRAKPSLAEAAALAAAVLEALGTMHEAGCTHGGLDSRSVRVGLRGDIRLAGGRPRRGGTGRPDAEQRRADNRAAAGIVAEILKAAGRPARPLTDREERLVSRLEAATDARSLSRRGLLRAAGAWTRCWVRWSVAGPPATG